MLVQTFISLDLISSIIKGGDSNQHENHLQYLLKKEVVCTFFRNFWTQISSQSKRQRSQSSNNFSENWRLHKEERAA